jgi:hypothetical protein
MGEKRVKEINGMMAALRTLLGIVILSIASIAATEAATPADTESHFPAGISAEIERNILVAAMGQMRGHYTYTCDMDRTDSAVCIDRAINVLVQNDRKNSINAVLNILKQTGSVDLKVPSIDLFQNYVDCKKDGKVWAEQLVGEVVTLLIDSDSDTQSSRATYSRDEENVSSYCEQGEMDRLKGLIVWVIKTLNPIRNEREKEVLRIRVEAQAMIQSVAEQKRKADEDAQQKAVVLAQERKAKQRKTAEENAKRDAQAREQAQRDEAERMKDPAYRAAKEREIDRAQRRKKCMDQIMSNYQECVVKNPGYANICSKVYQDSVPACLNIP